MKKKLLFTFLIMLSFSILFAQNPTEELDKWAAQQTNNINADDVVNHLNGGGDRDAGDITFGGEYVYNSTSTDFISATSLDSDHFVVAYSDNNNSGKAIVGTISGNSISYGSEFMFNLYITFDISISALDANNFVIAYTRGGSWQQLSYGAAIIGSVTGSTIVFGDEYTFHDGHNWGSVDFNSVTSLDANNFVIAYRSKNSYSNGDYSGISIIGTVSGNTISYGSEFTFNTANSVHISASSLGASSFIIAYTEGSGKVIIGSISGNSISFSPDFVFCTSYSRFISAITLDATKIVITYGINYYQGTSIIGNIAGNSISFGSEYIFNAEDSYYISAAKLDATHFIVTYQDYSNGRFGTVNLGTVSGNAISYGADYVFNPGSTYRCSAIAPDESKFIIAYQDRGNSYQGTAIVGEVESLPPPPAPPVPLNNWAIIIAVILMGALLWKKLF